MKRWLMILIRMLGGADGAGLHRWPWCMETSLWPLARDGSRSRCRAMWRRWYREAGVDAVLSDDADLRGALTGKKVAVLVYVSQPAASRKCGADGVCGARRQTDCLLFLVLRIGVADGGAVWGVSEGLDGWPQAFADEVFGRVRKACRGRFCGQSQNLFVVQPVEGRSRDGVVV